MEDKDVKIVNQGSFGYKGGITATIKHNGKPVKVINKHNAGTYALFRSLAGSLIGGDYSASMPQYLEAYQESGGNFYPLRARVKILDKHLEDQAPGSSDAVAVFVATIPYAALSLPGQNNIVKLALFSQFTEGFELAEVNLTEQGSEISLSGTGYSAVIEWRCVVHNA